MSYLIFEEKVKHNREAFVARVREIASQLGFNPNWLMACMYLESGLDHTAVNSIGAGGLIGFLKSTAEGFGTSVDALRKMSNVQQLDYVLKFYKMWGGSKHIKSFHDLRLMTFYPAAAIDKWPASKAFPDWVLKANKPLDFNKDGVLTVNDFANENLKRIPKKLRHLVFEEKKNSEQS